jgi:hypothetical protein
MSFTTTGNLMNKIDRLIQTIRNLKEEGAMMASPPTNNASSGNIKGFPPDSPPVNLKKRKTTYATGGLGSRRLWLQHLWGK